ncbi:MAG: hypothetical protein II670_05765 [Alphaproteobacteria bacterium]|nr:hypothetical protein [Alphaproteobacteria bacterium]
MKVSIGIVFVGSLMMSSILECKEKGVSEYKTAWVLDKYKSVDDVRIAKDEKELLQRVKKFDERFIKGLSVDNLKDAIVEYEKICATMSEMYSYFGLKFKLNTKDNNLSNACQKMTELFSKCDEMLCKFDIAMQKLDYKAIESKLKTDSELAQYKTYIKNVFKYRTHILSEPEEVLLAKIGACGNSWYKFHEGTLSRIAFPLDGKNLTLTDVVEKANNGETEQIRERASKALSDGLKKNEYSLVSVFNNIALEHKVFGEIRKYKSPEEPRYFADDISQEAVDNMLNAVTDHYAKICHRYYKLKAKILGKKKLQYWDRCSKVKLTSGEEKKYTYDEALQIVFDVYKNFSERFYEIVKDLSTSSHVDAFPKEGKVSGAFAWSMPHEKPYVLLNFYGSIRDITTIAHEFGHAIHMTLSLKNKYLVSNPALNISETASTFGEKLTNEHLLKNEANPKKKIELICSRLDDVMATIFRQTAFLKFERKIHDIRKDKELSVDELNKEWRKVLEESLGDGVEIDHCIDNYWGYITHFTNSPFYVYSYSFGALFVEGLYAEYKKTGKDFVKKYEEALASGGTKTYAEIAQMFGIDANSREFWNSAMSSIENEIDELEKLCDSEIRD